MVGEAAVSRETAWSCLASVMSTPLICKSVASQGALWGERSGWGSEQAPLPPLTERTRSPTCRVPARWAAPPSAMREMKMPCGGGGESQGQ